MSDERHNRLPVRLVQENGNTIPLSVTAYDITVERNHSQIPIPFANSKRLGIDQNMPQISVALTGIIADDDEIVEDTSGAIGKIDVGFQVGETSQQSTNMAGGLAGFGGIGLGGGATAPPPATGLSYLPTSYGANPTGPYLTAVSDLHGKAFTLPVSHWAGVGGVSQFPTAPTSNPAMWLKADTTALEGAGDSAEHGDNVQIWSDSGTNDYSPSQSTLALRPIFMDDRYNGESVLRFLGDKVIELQYNTSSHPLASGEVTIFVVCSGDTHGADGPIIENRDGTRGWWLKYGNTNDDFVFTWGNGSTSYSVDTANNLTAHHAHLISIVLEDTNGDGDADKGYMYYNGREDDTTNGVHAPPTSGTQKFRIGSTLSAAGGSSADWLTGNIGEIIIYNRALTEAERQATEAYLAGKYSLQLEDPNADKVHPYINASKAGTYHINYVFDANRRGSVKEPWGYENTSNGRETNLTITNITGSNPYVLTVDNDPREWIESSDLNDKYFRVRQHTTGAPHAMVQSVTSNSLTVLTSGSATFSIGQKITLRPHSLLSLPNQMTSIGGGPVIAIPIADLFDPPSTYHNGTTRDLAGAISPIEYLATKIAKAITLDDNLWHGKVINPNNNGTSSADAFSISVTQSEAGPQRGLVTITQKVHGAFQIGQGAIMHNFPMPTQGNAKPLFHAFTGGRSSTSEGRKSAGDKAQDLIGIINNMNNATQAGKKLPNSFGELVKGLEKAANTLTGQGGQKDYIEGVQIPYLSACLPTSKPEGKEVYIADATPSGSNTVITTIGTHNFKVGDRVEISSFSILNGTMAVNLNGTHSVSAVGSNIQFTISTSSSSNTGSAGGLCKRMPESNKKLQWEQRNLFITSGTNPRYQDVSSDNHNTLASTPFNKGRDDHKQSGMRTVIDEFTIDFKAEDRIYEFDMTMIAVDYLV